MESTSRVGPCGAFLARMVRLMGWPALGPDGGYSAPAAFRGSLPCPADRGQRPARNPAPLSTGAARPSYARTWSGQPESNRAVEGLEGPAVNPSPCPRCWLRRRESNPLPPGYEPGALPRMSYAATEGWPATALHFARGDIRVVGSAGRKRKSPLEAGCCRDTFPSTVSVAGTVGQQGCRSNSPDGTRLVGGRGDLRCESISCVARAQEARHLDLYRGGEALELRQ